MRAVSFVKRLQWELPGTICRHGLTIGDVDNDGDNELVVGTAEGELYIFKGSELWQKITGLGLVTSVAIGDIFNYGRNALVVICGDGWAHIFYSPRSVNPSNVPSLLTQLQLHKEDEQENLKAVTDIGTIINMTSSPSSEHVDNISEINELSGKMECVHVQRIPTNTKVVLVADIDKDGANEMILGLTDRVVRSYRWSSNTDFGTGRLVGLNKWECANQIGTVTLQHSRDGTPTLLVAQPGGTFMRIKCNAEDNRLENESCEGDNEVAASCVDYQTLGISRMRNQNISTEIIGDLESGMISLMASLESKVPKNIQQDTPAKQSFIDDSQSSLRNIKSLLVETKSNHPQSELRACDVDAAGVDQVDGNLVGGNVILGEFDSNPKKDLPLPTYEDFSYNNNNNNNSNKNNNINNNNNTEVQNENNKDDELDESKENSSRGKPYALATLDGTIMLVKDENILWAMQVDHQIFALCRLDVTNDGSDEIIACAWDGQTYILDQQRNSVRFQFEEPVRAFCTGYYNVVQRTPTPCLVYNTFNNKIFLYYDVTLPNMVISPLNPTVDLDEEERKILDEIIGESDETEKQRRMQQLTEWLLYGTH
ncbi:KICSTOR complex protein ITFG2-like [Vespula squamosa]|uniref:KICSTOR complex protein ITFG2-like n=1 Tax=Vespula squamosa TaxID=30214 RepID=A0ABD2ATI1_VESSQ